MITIEDYTGFFLAVILGLGITFELPILIFFLALFGIVDAQVPAQALPLRHPRHLPRRRHHLPHARPIGMCLFATAHARALLPRRRLSPSSSIPTRRKKKELSA